MFPVNSSRFNGIVISKVIGYTNFVKWVISKESALHNQVLFFNYTDMISAITSQYIMSNRRAKYIMIKCMYAIRYID